MQHWTEEDRWQIENKNHLHGRPQTAIVAASVVIVSVVINLDNTLVGNTYSVWIQATDITT